jgi:DNA-binding SARP family transcriptional activator
MPVVRVRLFGHSRIDVRDECIETRLSEQSLLLFAMLVTRPHEALGREEVAFTLWPDHTESDAKAALRRHVYKLQHAFPASGEPWVCCSAKSIAWSHPEQTWVDVNEFRRFSADPTTLAKAASLYGGDFLPFADHEWAANLRERLRREACATLEALVRRETRSADPYATLPYVEQLLAHDPFREDVVRTLMALRWRLGDRAGALSAYRRFGQRLADEFGVDPMPETASLYRAIVCGDLAPTVSASSTLLASA